MSDFHQNGLVTVLHRLGASNLEQLEKELERHAASNPIALVLPSLYSELENPALKHIVQVLKDIRYVNEIVISLDRASALEFRLAKQFFSVLPQRVRIVWNDGAGIQDILKLLANTEIDTGLQGKGRGCWMAFGYVLARGQSNVIALHDCDILSYNREYLARLQPRLRVLQGLLQPGHKSPPRPCHQAVSHAADPKPPTGGRIASVADLPG